MNVIPQSSIWTQKVASRFGKAVGSYDKFAVAQKKMAAQLADAIFEVRNFVPYGSILEIGCGTGLLTDHLPLLFPYRDLIITDAAQEMVRLCSNKFHGRFPGAFVVMDGENPPADQKFACIVSNFAFHWFGDLSGAVQKLSKSLSPKGKLIFSIPEKNSFAEWRDICALEGLPFTGNTLPTMEDIEKAATEAGLTAQFKRVSAVVEHESLAEALHALRGIGASTKRGEGALSVANVRQLMKRTGPVKLSYEVIIAVMTKAE